jgi:phosphonate transport system substrate-binding protein
MLHRRTVIASTASLGLSAAVPLAAGAQDWKARYPELVFAVAPGENSAGVIDRWGPLLRHLEREIGIRFTLRIVQDFAAVIEGQRAGQIHIVWHGPSSYARARMTGVQIEPFAMDVNADGSTGYYSAFYVKADSPFRTIEDLRGKRLGLVDPNSTSGNTVPRFALDKMGIRPQEFFSNVVYAGGHETAIIALGQGVVDVAVTWWNSETDSNVARMSAKRMIRGEDFRLIHRSDLIANGPYAYLTSLPEELRARIRTAWLAAPANDPQAVRHRFDGKGGSFAPVTHETYLPIIALNQFIDRLRRQGS